MSQIRRRGFGRQCLGRMIQYSFVFVKFHETWEVLVIYLHSGLVLVYRYLGKDIQVHLRSRSEDRTQISALEGQSNPFVVQDGH